MKLIISLSLFIITFSSFAAKDICNYDVFSYKSCKTLAEKNDALAQNVLSMLYYFGIGITRNPNEGLKWIEKSANNGNAIAQNNLGTLYLNGTYPLKKDLKKSFEWFRKSAEQGVAEAQYNLASSYHNAKGVEKNDEDAFYWYQKAADQNNTAVIPHLIQE
ncbi:MAG: sel1 repeat family protein [Enterobacteriaceae bacterium]|jgi:TPR repeat protein|nr:sel1 repeat family protein [Enterobacteriaceae bacterium]